MATPMASEARHAQPLVAPVASMASIGSGAAAAGPARLAQPLVAPVVVLMTVPSPEEGRKIADALVTGKLAA